MQIAFCGILTGAGAAILGEPSAVWVRSHTTRGRPHIFCGCGQTNVLWKVSDAKVRLIHFVGERERTRRGRERRRKVRPFPLDQSKNRGKIESKICFIFSIIFRNKSYFSPNMIPRSTWTYSYFIGSIFF